MIELTIFGILSSVFAEVVTAINKKLSGTVLKGDAAFLIVLALSFVGAFIKMALAPGFMWISLTDYSTFGQTFGTIFAASQVYFYFIVQKLNLDVSSTPTLPAPATTTPTI